MPPAPAFTPNQIISAFSQGAPGNCASISVIKLALFQYGLEQTLQPVPQPDGYSITLLDGKVIQISNAELQAVNVAGDFENIQDANITTQAQLMYAVMVKNKCLQQAGCVTLTDVLDPAAHYLDMDTTNNFGYLGLSGKYNTLANFDTNYLSTLDAYILTNFKHSAFGCGANYDEDGTPTPITDFVNNHSSLATRLFGNRQINGAYTLQV